MSKKKETLQEQEKPKTKYQNFVHMCDFLASRKCLLVPFDKNDDISV